MTGKTYQNGKKELYNAPNFTNLPVLYVGLHYLYE